jgi:hypothetical protein
VAPRVLENFCTVGLGNIIYNSGNMDTLNEICEILLIKSMGE